MLEVIALFTPKILIAATIAWLLAMLIFRFRKRALRTEARMRRFLDRHFDVIRHKGFWEKERDYIDRSLVKEWSKSKMWMFWLWTLNSGIFYSLGHYNDRIFMQMLSLVFVISAGFWRTDSWAALHCLEKLGMPQYRPKNFSEGAVVDRELIADPDLFVK